MSRFDPIYFKLLNDEWNNLSNHGNNGDKCDLIWQQLIGFIERRLSAVDRQAFAQDVETITSLHVMKRSLAYNYEYANQNEFPRSDIDSSHDGLGFDFAVSIYGADCPRGVATLGGDCRCFEVMSSFEKLCRAKASGFSEVKQQLQHSTSQHEVNRDMHKSRSCMIV
ncbi:MAG TPA: hypothetical protein VJN02_11615 [Gammaproteobacteria bacterium]|nr:hypothetical protein [Gammaproteobacteria bacterium]